MPLTVPDDINYPDTDYAGGFVPAMALMATSVQSALSVRAAKSYRWPNQAARSAQTGMVIDSRGYQENNDKSYRFNGSSWVEQVSGDVCVALAKSANQNFTSTALMALTWDVELRDLSGMHDNVNPTRMTATVSGLYLVTASVYNNNTSGQGVIQARLSGVGDIRGSFDRRTADVAGLTLKSAFPITLNAGDYVEILVSHTTATGNISGGTTTGAATVSMVRVGA